MPRLLHTKQRIKIKNPYVILMTHTPAKSFSSDHEIAYQELIKFVRGQAVETWGYSELWTTDGQKVTYPFYPQFQSEDKKVISYWFFKDEQDALAFRLKAYGKCQQVHMWPGKITFTVFEYVPAFEN